MEASAVVDDEEWRASNALARDMRLLDFDTKKSEGVIGGVSSTVALRAREAALKKDHGMEHPEDILELANVWDHSSRTVIEVSHHSLLDEAALDIDPQEEDKGEVEVSPYN